MEEGNKFLLEMLGYLEESTAKVSTPGQAAEYQICRYLSSGESNNIDVRYPSMGKEDTKYHLDRFVDKKGTNFLDKVSTDKYWDISCRRIAKSLSERLRNGVIYWADGWYRGGGQVDLFLSNIVNLIQGSSYFRDRNKWNPADLWYFSSGTELAEANKKLSSLLSEPGDADEKISEFTEWIDRKFDAGKIIGISLKKLKIYLSDIDLTSAKIETVIPGSLKVKKPGPGKEDSVETVKHNLFANAANIMFELESGKRGRLRIIIENSYFNGNSLDIPIENHDKRPVIRASFIFDDNVEAKVGSASISVSAHKLEKDLIPLPNSVVAGIWNSSKTNGEFLQKLCEEISKEDVLDSMIAYITSTSSYRKSETLVLKSAKHWRVDTER